MKFRQTLVSYLKEIGIDHTHAEVSKCLLYLNILFEENKKMNLVGTKQKDQILIRHFLDSLSILDYREEFFRTGDKILDIGSGGGLPGMLLSIFLPRKKIFLLDKSLKKTNFLRNAVDNLDLKNVVLIRGRAEQLAKDIKHREAYDLVVARAVTKFSILAEIVIPFSAIHGKIILYKSRMVYEEVQNHKDFVKKLGGNIKGLHKANIPELPEFRVFLEINKQQSTPQKYPRPFSKIKRSPAS